MLCPFRQYLEAAQKWLSNAWDRNNIGLPTGKGYGSKLLFLEQDGLLIL